MNKVEKKVLVSVCCTAFNHEKYIRSCLDGFVNQKTNFRYEVIVHDDASTDNTPIIIQEYADKYPDIIKPILQTENQYSKGIPIYEEYLYPKCTGKYLAFCEGDDYWCDDNKLQKQINILENNPDYIACVHQTKMINLRDDKNSFFVAYTQNCTIEVEKFFNDTIPYHVSSLMVRVDLDEKRPDFCFISKQVGDYPNGLYLALKGNIYFISDVMSVYRRFTEGSWSIKNVSKPNPELWEDMIKILTLADEYSNFKYHKLVDKKKIGYEYKLWKHTAGFEVFNNERFKILSASKKLKMIFYILCRKFGFHIK